MTKHEALAYVRVHARAPHIRLIAKGLLQKPGYITIWLWIEKEPKPISMCGNI